MVNFRINLAGPQCPDIWSNIILAVSVRSTLKFVDFEESRLPLIMWVGLIQSVEGLATVKTDLPEQEGILPIGDLPT